MKRRFQIVAIFLLAIGINIFAEISAQQPLPKGQAPKSIQDEDRAARMLAQADKKDAPKADVHGRGLVKPADLDKRIAASWAKHGKKLQALPHISATAFDCRDMSWVPPFDDQGSCGSCFPPNTLITMANGSTKTIDKIKIGDLVRSAEGNACPVRWTVSRSIKEPLVRIFAGGRFLDATECHHIKTDQGYRAISTLKLGQLVKVDDGYKRLTSISEGKVYSGLVYNLEVEFDHSYIANGIGVHNCWLFSGVDVCAAALYKSGKLKSGQSLSKQMALDCNFRDACGGGWPEDAIAYVRDHGVPTDADYPTAYHAGPGTCKDVDASKIFRVIQSGYVAQGGNPTYQQLKDAMVRYGVLSICYDASDTPTGPPDKTKVWKGSGGRSIDHAIKVIAFDDSLSPKGGILCWNQWYNDSRDLWWAEYGANGLGDSLMWVDAGDAPTPIPPVPPSPDGAPTITSPLAVVAQAGQPFTYQITATNDPKIFYALPAVEGITVNAVTGQVTGTPTAIGTITVNLVAGNTKGAGQATLTITVSDKPVPPVPPNPTDGFTGSVTTIYKNGVIVSVAVGGSNGLEADLKNAGVSPAIIADVLKLFADLVGKQPTNVLIQDVLKVFMDLVASDPKAYEAMPKGTP